MTTREAVTRIEQELAGRDFGSLRVHAAAVTLDQDQDGDDVTRVVLRVSDPAPSHSTWPADDADAAAQAARQLVAGAEVELPYAIVRFVPVTPDEDVDDVESPFGTSDA